jgi:hypothetical protein
MTTYIPEALRREVLQRAKGRCEYCGVHQHDRLFAHEIDHIYAEKHGGQSQSNNLSVACSECNRFKGSDLCSLDPVTNTIVALFHPRQQLWRDHFRLKGNIIEPLTPTGRVTERLLRFNEADTVERRRLLIEAGRYQTP